MAIKPLEALNFVSKELNERINDLEVVIDDYLSLNYCGCEIDMPLKDHESILTYKEIANKSFFNQKVMIELSRRYVDWNVTLCDSKKGMSIKFSEKSQTPNLEVEKTEPFLNQMNS